MISHQNASKFPLNSIKQRHKLLIHVTKREKKQQHRICSCGPAVNIMHTVDVLLNAGCEYSVCDASAGCKWKAILLPVSHHYSFWQLFKKCAILLCICVSVVCRACSPCSCVRVSVCYYECVCVPFGGVGPRACLLAGMNFTPSWRCSNIIMCDRHMRHEMSIKTTNFIATA